MTVDLDDIEDAIRGHADPVTTASELADDLDCSSRHVLDLLRLLERAGAVESKKVGARAIAWWHVDRVQDSHERITSEQPESDQEIASELSENNERATSEQPTNDERRDNEESTDGEATESIDAIERAVDRAAEHWDDPERIDQRKQAARAALQAIREQPMSKSEVLEEVEPNHPVDGQSKRTWWRKNLSECSPSPLKQLAEYSNSTKKWEWKG